MCLLMSVLLLLLLLLLLLHSLPWQVPLLKDLFADKRTDDEKKHRPPAAVTQFKTSVNALMVSLKASNPHYVRHITVTDPPCSH